MSDDRPAGVSARYLAEAERRLAAASVANRDALAAAAQVVADAVGGGGVVHVAGAGHSQLLALELAGRAGGLAAIDVIFDPGWGADEATEGHAATLLRDTVVRPGDCLVVISTAGRNAFPVEMALLGRDAGMPVIALTSPEASRSAPARHPSGRRLFEIADVVLDTGTPAGDAAVAVPGVAVRTGPTSTVTGAALLHALVAGAIAEMQRRGVDPPVLVSHAVEGGRAHNDALRARYAGRARTPI